MDTNDKDIKQKDQPILTAPAPEAMLTAETPQVVPQSEPQNEYQGVLSNYKDEINPPVPTPETEAPLVTPPIMTSEIPASDYSDPEVAQKKLEEILNTPTAIPEENSTPISPTIDTSPKSSVFRTVFLVALFLFLGISAVIAYFLIKGPAAPSAPVVIPTITETPTLIPTNAPITSVCALNGKEYKIGESFASVDGCNICSCTTDLSIACTERACSATPSSTIITPTKTATATPTKTL